jgi:hypothetical protein
MFKNGFEKIAGPITKGLKEAGLNSKGTREAVAKMLTSHGEDFGGVPLRKRFGQVAVETSGKVKDHTTRNTAISFNFGGSHTRGNFNSTGGLPTHKTDYTKTPSLHTNPNLDYHANKKK